MSNTETTCKRGHDLTDPTNAYVRSNGKVDCRTCERENRAARAAERRAANIAAVQATPLVEIAEIVKPAVLATIEAPTKPAKAQRVSVPDRRAAAVAAADEKARAREAKAKDAKTANTKPAARMTDAERKAKKRAQHVAYWAKFTPEEREAALELRREWRRARIAKAAAANA